MQNQKPVRIAFVRHGETDWNAVGRFQGVSDIPLNETGLGQATNAVEFLRDEGPWDELRYSPLARAAKTGEIIAGELGIETRRVEPLLVERDWGAAEGRTLVEMREDYPELRDVPDSDVRQHIPFAEDIDLVVARGRHVVAKLAGTRPGKRILCTLHGTIQRATINDILGDDIGFVPNTGAVVFDAWHGENGLELEIVAQSYVPEPHPSDQTQSGSSRSRR